MAAPTEEELRDAVDEVALRALIANYADVVNRREWTELESLFVADAPITIDLRDRAPLEIEGPAAVGEFIGGAIERFAFFEFVALNVRVQVRVGDVDRAHVRTYMCELRQDHDGAFTRAFGIYQDDVTRTPLGWRFARRSYQSIARGDTTLDVLVPPEIQDPG
ncbi:MAG: nuclear transport factor 2 family protein [Acidimicrobiia bacterium]